MLVLEQNSYLGGGASTCQINGVDFDIGTYFVGQVRTNIDVKGILFLKLLNCTSISAHVWLFTISPLIERGLHTQFCNN